MRGGCQFHARAVERALEQMGKGKSPPSVQSPCPAQHLCRPGIPQHCPSTGGFPRKSHFFAYFQEKSHSLPAEELKCRNSCSQHNPPVARVGAAPCVCLSAFLTMVLLHREHGLELPEQGQGRVSPLLALLPHTAPRFSTWIHRAFVLFSWDLGPAELGQIPRGSCGTGWARCHLTPCLT